MASPRKYRVPNPARYRRVHEIHRQRAEGCRAHALDGTRLNHWNLSSWLECALELAGGALAFGEDDAVVAAHFADAVEASRYWLRAGKPWRPRPQPVDPKVTRHLVGDKIFEVTEMLPRMAEIGWIEDWNSDTFEAALSLFIAFGSAEDVRAAATIPEVAYRSPDMVSDASAYPALRALKALALEDHEDARAACREALESPPPKTPRQFVRGLLLGRGIELAKTRAILALSKGQRKPFLEALAELEAAHKKLYASTPGTALRFYSLNGLTLAQLARRSGIEVADTLLIPTRLLPRPQ